MWPLEAAQSQPNSHAAMTVVRPWPCGRGARQVAAIFPRPGESFPGVPVARLAGSGSGQIGNRA